MSTAALHDRPARATDALAIAALHADSWRRNYRGAYSDAFLDGDVEAERRGVWSQRLATPDPLRRTRVAERGGTLVAFAHTAFDADPEWGALLDNLHVRHADRRGGIGSRLLADSAGAVLERGGRGLFLWVLEQNTAAQAFYGALGGRHAGERAVPAPGGIAERLDGAPVALRYAWSDAAALVDRARRF